MTEPRSSDTALADRTRAFSTESAIVDVHFLADTAVFVLSEEALLFVSPENDQRRVQVHGGGILKSTADGKRVITAGDDGKVVATDAKGETQILAEDEKHRWIDHVAVGADGAIAWSAGKTAFVKTAKGE